MKNETTKQCSICKVFKNTDFFAKRYDRKSGFRSSCRECDRKKESLRVRRPLTEERKLKIKQYRKTHKEQIYKNKKKYTLSEKGKRKAAEYRKKYYKEKREIVKRLSAEYRANKLKATPKWLTQQMKIDIELTYLFASACTNASQGKQVYCVDHIVPLNNPIICGLHVPWNLQVITKSQNSSKNNKLIGV